MRLVNPSNRCDVLPLFDGMYYSTVVVKAA